MIIIGVDFHPEFQEAMLRQLTLRPFTLSVLPKTSDNHAGRDYKLIADL
jgi:hypothetical protein